MPRAANAAASSRSRGKPFAPGVSGNPKGRASGSRPLALLRLDAQAEGEARTVLKSVMDAAKGGDMAAAGLILARIWPARRGRPVTGLPSLPTDAASALSAILDAITSGSVSPEEGETVARVVRHRAEAEEWRDIAARLAVLEGRQESTL